MNCNNLTEIQNICGNITCDCYNNPLLKISETLTYMPTYQKMIIIVSIFTGILIIVLWSISKIKSKLIIKD